MMVSKPVKSALACGVAFGAFALLASAALAQVPASCVKGVDLATLGPTSIVGQGPHGEKAASPEMLKLSDAVWVMRAGRCVAGRRTRDTDGDEIVGLITGARPDDVPAATT